MLIVSFRYEFLNNSGVEVEEKPNDSEVTTSSPPPPPVPGPRIRPEVREQHCKTLRLALHVWLDQYPEDFREPPNYPCLNQLEAFTHRIMPSSELDDKVKRKGVHIRRPPPPPPPSSLSSLPPPGCEAPPSSKSRHKSPPPLVLKSAHSESSIIPSVARGLVGGSNGNGPPPLPPKPAARSSSHPPAPFYTDFLDIPDQIFAQQLTRMDCVSWFFFF